MKPSDIRNHISQQCGFNKAKQGVWDEKSKTFIKPSGTVQQGRRPMFKPYALQVCNAGAMPEDFSAWLKANGDSIPIEDYGGNIVPSRIQSNLDRYDERPFDGEDTEEWMRRSEQQGE